MPEVVTHGETGFIVDTVEEMVAAVKEIPKISRKACRERVEKLFSVVAMVDGYEKAFLRLVERSLPQHRSNRGGPAAEAAAPFSGPARSRAGSAGRRSPRPGDAALP